MTTTHRLFASLVLALALGAAPAGDARPRHSPAEHIARHAERLGLDAQAQAAIAEIVAASEAQDEVLDEEIRTAHKRMRELLSAPETDHAAVMAEADALDALHARSHRNRLETVLRIHELLTPEQRAELVAIRNEERPWKRGRGPLGRCSTDLREQCAGAADGPAALRCLADHWPDLSERCREAVVPPPPE